jgi:hypothetical protein
MGPLAINLAGALTFCGLFQATSTRAGLTAGTRPISRDLFSTRCGITVQPTATTFATATQLII